MYSLIVIDEVSMVTDDIFMDLMSLGLPIIGLGDHNQLPPVGHSQCHEFVLNPDVRFDKSIRHGDGNYILTLAEEVLKSPYLRTGLYGKNVKIVKFATKEYYTHADQIICCTNKMRNIISRKMRFDKDIDADAYPLPLAGEKIISKINDWGQTIFSENGWGTINLINGLVGYCIGDFNSYTNTLTFMPYYHKVIAFENIKVDHMTFVEDNVNLDKELLFKNLYEHGLHTFEYAYALTVHSSQGSEFDDVVVFAKDIWGNTDMRKKMLYTAITRAKKNLTLII
jgi:exodeoxyribonuclease-5